MHNTHLVGRIGTDRVTGQRVVVVDGSTMSTGLKVRFPDGATTTISRNSVDLIPVPQPDPKPFYVLTRLYKANGDCEKRTHTFPTRKAQQAFIRRTHRAVTAFN